MTDDGMTPGLYAAADNPRQLTPVLTEGNNDETAVLVSELEDAGIGSFGARNTYRDLADDLLQTISFVEGQNGAHIGELVAEHSQDTHFTEVLAVLLDLSRNGKIYAPSKSRVKTVEDNIPEKEAEAP